MTEQHPTQKPVIADSVVELIGRTPLVRLHRVVPEGAALILPDYARQARVPGVVFLPLRGTERAWSLWVAWQRGRASAAVRAIGFSTSTCFPA